MCQTATIKYGVLNSGLNMSMLSSQILRQMFLFGSVEQLKEELEDLRGHPGPQTKTTSLVLGSLSP